MEMTKQRKLLATVLCLGLGALVLDRFVLSAPESASADQAEVVEPSSIPDLSGPSLVTDAPSPGDAQISSMPSYASLTQRLVQAQSLQPSQTNSGSPDPFAVPKDWQPTRPAVLETANGAAIDPAKPDKAFLQKHKLDGTFRSGQEQRAIVAGKALRIGEELMGYRLMQINSRWVLWQSIDGERPVVMHAADGLAEAARDSIKAP